MKSFILGYTNGQVNADLALADIIFKAFGGKGIEALRRKADKGLETYAPNKTMYSIGNSTYEAALTVGGIYLAVNFGPELAKLAVNKAVETIASISLLGMSKDGTLVWEYVVIQEQAKQAVADSLTVLINVGSGLLLSKMNSSVQNAIKNIDTIKKGNYNKVDDSYLKKKGVDAHELKKEVLGKKAKISHYDIYVNKDTGELVVFGKDGKGIGIPTGEFIK